MQEEKEITAKSALFDYDDILDTNVAAKFLVRIRKDNFKNEVNSQKAENCLNQTSGKINVKLIDRKKMEKWNNKGKFLSKNVFD